MNVNNIINNTYEQMRKSYENKKQILRKLTFVIRKRVNLLIHKVETRLREFNTHRTC